MGYTETRVLAESHAVYVRPAWQTRPERCPHCRRVVKEGEAVVLRRMWQRHDFPHKRGNQRMWWAVWHEGCVEEVVREAADADSLAGAPAR